MNPDELLTQGQAPTSSSMPGVYPAFVTNISDPDNLGRVKVTLPLAPDASGTRFEAWARLGTLMAGRDRGTWFVPDVGDEVLVAFQGGDPGVPFVIGALWNGVDRPPAHMDGGAQNRVKSIRTRNGLTLEFKDENGQESITLTTPGGDKLVMADGPGRVTIQDSNGNLIRLDSGGITVRSSGTLRLEGSEVRIHASTIKLDAGRVEGAGLIKTGTLVADAVVAASYTPGAGNVL